MLRVYKHCTLQQKAPMAAFSVHHLNESLRHLVTDSQQCTAPGAQTRPVSRVGAEMVQYSRDRFALCPAMSPAVEFLKDLKPAHYYYYKWKVEVTLSRKRCRGTLQDYDKGEISKCQSKLWTNRNVFSWCLNGTREDIRSVLNKWRLKCFVSSVCLRTQIHIQPNKEFLSHTPHREKSPQTIQFFKK